MNKITLSRTDFDLIKDIVIENEIEFWTLIQDSSSGIGSSLDLEYDTEIKGRPATVRIPIGTVDNW